MFKFEVEPSCAHCKLLVRHVGVARKTDTGTTPNK